MYVLRITAKKGRNQPIGCKDNTLERRLQAFWRFYATKYLKDIKFQGVHRVLMHLCVIFAPVLASRVLKCTPTGLKTGSLAAVVKRCE